MASLEGMGSLSDWWQVFRVTQVGQTQSPWSSDLSALQRRHGSVCIMQVSWPHCSTAESTSSVEDHTMLPLDTLTRLDFCATRSV